MYSATLAQASHRSTRDGRFGAVPVTESAVVGIVLRDEALAVFGSDEVASVEPLRPRPLGATVVVWRVRVADRSAVLKLLRLGAGSNINWAASPSRTSPVVAARTRRAT